MFVCVGLWGSSVCGFGVCCFRFILCVCLCRFVGCFAVRVWCVLLLFGVFRCVLSGSMCVSLLYVYVRWLCFVCCVLIVRLRCVMCLFVSLSGCLVMCASVWVVLYCSFVVFVWVCVAVLCVLACVWCSM